MKTVIIKMTTAYDYQEFHNSIDNIEILDCSQIEGTKCYLDDEARTEITKLIEDNRDSTIHFIDSGNYHYLSLLWLEQINEDFNLVVFDHHPDDQPPSFGDIISCGGWVLKSKENLNHLKNVYTFGANPTGSNDPLPGFSDYVDIAQSIPNDLPVFISIDKDVLSLDESITDWDQGEMKLDEMLILLSEVVKDRRIIGVDICGDTGENPMDGAEINNQTNRILFDFFSKNL